MFALGCILYETTTGERLFASDYAVRDYATGYRDLKRWPNCDPSSRLHSLGQLASQLLKINPCDRPGAFQTATILASLRQGMQSELGSVMSEDDLPFRVDPSQRVQHGTSAGRITYRSTVSSLGVGEQSRAPQEAFRPSAHLSVHGRSGTLRCMQCRSRKKRV
jgi:hypothetical protein